MPAMDNQSFSLDPPDLAPDVEREPSPLRLRRRSSASITPSIAELKKIDDEESDELMKKAYVEPWRAWITQPYQLIRVRKAGRQEWRFCYALEKKGLVWGGSLKIAWAIDGARGGVPSGSHRVGDGTHNESA